MTFPSRGTSGGSGGVRDEEYETTVVDGSGGKSPHNTLRFVVVSGYCKDPTLHHS